jgi:hypothetical protein
MQGLAYAGPLKGEKILSPTQQIAHQRGVRLESDLKDQRFAFILINLQYNCRNPSGITLAKHEG